ncbi:hypothetical protein [Euzebya pacifica]|nr:hypothetical protein [Euzebya pacifica]
MPATVLTGPPLAAVRDLLDGADRALLAVAYLRPAGVGLLRDRLAGVADGRLLVATDRVTTADGIAAARSRRFEVRGHTPPRGAFHAKSWLVHRPGGGWTALVGSGNCTGGLAVNDEAHTLLDGPDVQDTLGRLAMAFEDRWAAADRRPEDTIPELRTVDVVRAGLWGPLAATLEADPVVETATGAANTVVAFDRTGFSVTTGASAAKGSGAQRVDPWMVEVVHDHLLAHGIVSSKVVQGNSGDGGLNVKRSAFVLGLLARHPDIEWASRQRGSVAIRLRR